MWCNYHNPNFESLKDQIHDDFSHAYPLHGLHDVTRKFCESCWTSDLNNLRGGVN